jgi:hypothetical protein
VNGYKFLHIQFSFFVSSNDAKPQSLVSDFLASFPQTQELLCMQIGHALTEIGKNLLFL